MQQFKTESIKQTVEYVKNELGCSDLEAVSKLQATAAKQGNDELLDDLCAYKWELIEC